MTYESLSHSKWDCTYQIVIVPKYRKKFLYGRVRRYLGPKFHELANQRGNKIVEGHVVQDHVHMMIQIPPKYSVSEVIGYLKGKSAIAQLLESVVVRRKTLMEKSCGPEVMLYLRLVLRK